MSDAENLETFLVLAALKGGGSDHDERVGVNLRRLRRTQTRVDVFLLREFDELFCQRSRLDEPLCDVVLGPRGGIVGVCLSEHLGLCPAAFGVEEQNLERPDGDRNGSSAAVDPPGGQTETHLGPVILSAVRSFFSYLRDLPAFCERPAALRRWCTFATQ